MDSSSSAVAVCGPSEGDRHLSQAQSDLGSKWHTEEWERAREAGEPVFGGGKAVWTSARQCRGKQVSLLLSGTQRQKAFPPPAWEMTDRKLDTVYLPETQIWPSSTWLFF